MFDYDEMTTRNIGFINQAEQQRLQNATVFICGTGGMGGAAVQSLVRCGVSHLILADIDEYEISNLNRQVFCNLQTIGQHKAEATRSACLQINPEASIDVFKTQWPEHINEIMESVDVVINGTDDLGASLLLYRTARQYGKPVIDAYASPLPSVYVTRPSSPMPEERLKYPTLDTQWNQLNDTQRNQAFLCEAHYIMLHSSSRHYVDLKLAGEVAAGKRSRMSFAPMVINTGTLMAYEVISSLLGKPSKTDEQGWFFNPYTAKVEKPWPVPVAKVLSPIVRHALNKILTQS